MKAALGEASIAAFEQKRFSGGLVVVVYMCINIYIYYKTFLRSRVSFL